MEPERALNFDFSSSKYGAGLSEVETEASSLLEDLCGKDLLGLMEKIEKEASS